MSPSFRTNRSASSFIALPCFTSTSTIRLAPCSTQILRLGARNCLFPTLPTTLDAFIDVLHEPLRPAIHRKFSSHVSSWIAYLRQYTFPGKGFYTTVDPNTKKTSITPEVLSIIAQTKEVNHPTLIRQLSTVSSHTAARVCAVGYDKLLMSSD
jgi:hypothetical protein